MSSSPSPLKKLILVIGATGAQGQAVIDSLLAPCVDGSPSPYAVRALTRDITNHRVQELVARGVECVQGTHLLPIVALSLRVTDLIHLPQGRLMISRPSSLRCRGPTGRGSTSTDLP